MGAVLARRLACALVALAIVTPVAVVRAGDAGADTVAACPGTAVPAVTA